MDGVPVVFDDADGGSNDPEKEMLMAIINFIHCKERERERERERCFILEKEEVHRDEDKALKEEGQIC